MRYLLFTVLWIGLAVYSIVDILNQRDDSPFGLPKPLWVIIVVLAPLIGSLVWIALRWLGRPGARPEPRAPLAPDDDPEYLTWLREQERRRDRGL